MMKAKAAARRVVSSYGPWTVCGDASGCAELDGMGLAGRGYVA